MTKILIPYGIYGTNDHFIPDGMNDFERSVKRVGDCLLAFYWSYYFFRLYF